MDLGKRVMCRCLPGFTGTHCETNIDDCASSPCSNAGTCFDLDNDFRCACTLGFTGKDCSVRKSPCDLFHCDNGGTCFTHYSGPVCKCLLGFMGARCEHVVEKPTTKPPEGDAPPALIAALALGMVTLSLLLCAAVHVLHHFHRRRAIRSISTSVKNDLERVNNAVVGGGLPNNGSLHGAPLGSFKEKEAFLISGGQLKVSNKAAALSGDTGSIFKNKMADCNLTKEDQNLGKSKFDL